MGIKPMFGSGAVAAKVMAFQQNLERATEFLLKYLGEELAKYAKDNHNYTSFIIPTFASGISVVVTSQVLGSRLFLQFFKCLGKCLFHHAISLGGFTG